jgi:hypothetical protein
MGTYRYESWVPKCPHNLRKVCYPAKRSSAFYSRGLGTHVDAEAIHMVSICTYYGVPGRTWLLGRLVEGAYCQLLLRLQDLSESKYMFSLH